MKKLHVKIKDQWLPVFCNMQGTIITCADHPERALPPRALWADDDLKYFQNKFANNEFCLREI